MYQLKGFASIEPLIRNTPGEISPLGEISTYSMTYTRERGEYYDPAISAIKLVSVSSTDTSTGKVAVSKAYADHALQVADFIYQFAVTKNGEVFKDELTTALAINFQGVAADFILGNIINNGTIYMPEWVSWHKGGNNDNNLKLWFSDSAFRRQFDEYEIVVIPPTTSLEDFFKTPTEVKTIMESRTETGAMDAVQIAKNYHPETVIRLETYDYVNPNYPGVKIPTKWYVLIYGIAGDNIDAIKDAIAEYILSNNTHTRDEWKAILPELFKRTEFLVFPRWDLYAIPNLTIQAGIYSPMLNLQESVAYLKSKLPQATPTFLEAYITSFTHPYKSIAALALGGEENKDAKYKLTDYFPDYIHVGTTSLDFNRMAQATKDWSVMMERLLITAETMNEYSDIPPETRRLKRDGILYIVQRFNNVQYLVAAKQQA